MLAQAKGFDEAVLDRIADHPRLPTPPAVALQVLDRAGRPDCTTHEIADLVSHDPALCGKLLQTANSALYSRPHAVTSVHRAVTLLGLRSVRSLVLSLSLPALCRGSANDGPSREYWKSSVAGAIIARELAVRLHRPEPDDDLVAGLLRDIGEVILRQLYPDEYAQVLDGVAAAQCERERAVLGVHHAEVGAYVLRRWRLPEEITEAIRCHHHPGEAAALPRPAAERATLLAFATQLAQLQLTPHEPEISRTVREQARGRFGLDERRLDEFLAALGPRIAEFAALLSVDIGRCPDYAAVVADASAELVRLTQETCRDQLRSHEEKDRAEREAQHWRQAAQSLRGRADCDPLTGVYNRGFFEEALEAAFKAARWQCTTLGLLFLDLDDFKPLNDRYGHAFGDQVLQDVARQLRFQAGARATVARYGGDEFCVLVPGLFVPELRAHAEKLWQGIAGLTVRHGSDCGRVAVSVGAALCFPYYSSFTARQLLAVADKAMYLAKKTGKNQVFAVPLMTVEEERLLEDVRRRRFSSVLAARACAAGPRLPEAVLLLPAPRWRVGRVARKLDWLSSDALRAVLLEQRKTGKPFGDIAVALGHLTLTQVWYLLAMQQEWPEDLADMLVDLGVLTEDEARAELEAYLGAARAGSTP